MQVGEEQQVWTQESVLGRHRLLDLDHHLGRPRVRRRGHDARARQRVLLVGEAAAIARRLLDQHLVAGLHQHTRTRGGAGHAVLFDLNFFGNADFHCAFL
jgi:hypothetical protein